MDGGEREGTEDNGGTWWGKPPESKILDNWAWISSSLSEKDIGRMLNLSIPFSSHESGSLNILSAMALPGTPPMEVRGVGDTKGESTTSRSGYLKTFLTMVENANSTRLLNMD